MLYNIYIENLEPNMDGDGRIIICAVFLKVFPQWGEVNPFAHSGCYTGDHWLKTADKGMASWLSTYGYCIYIQMDWYWPFIENRFRNKF